MHPDKRMAMTTRSAMGAGSGMPPAAMPLRGPDPALPPTLVFAAGFVFGLLFNAAAPLPLTRSHPAALGIVGWLLAGGGMALFLWALGLFARARTGILLQKPARELVARGPYAWSRNPQYVGFVAIYLGATLVANAWWPLMLLLPVVLTVDAVVIGAEEHHMHAVFGPDYDAYRRRVRRWL
jgi:protein-S-isoprenylcysteine O-methyltransferase Ste14